MRYGSNNRRGLGRSLLTLSAIAVFGLFGGILWFAYADVIGLGAGGPPPLIKAELGPIKRVPDDPGGMAITERSPASGILEEQVEPVRRERILPREETPVAMPEPEPAPETVAREPPSSPEAPPADGPVVEALAAPEPAPPAVAPAPTPALIAPLAAREPEPTAVPAAVTEPAEPTPAAVSSPPPAIAAPDPAPRPPPERPATAETRPATPERPAVTATAEPARSAPAATATFRIQLGAFRSENAASQAWTDLQRRNAPVLGELRANITEAETSSGTFFRLQAGSLRSRDAAVQTCAQLKAAGNDCFVVGPLP